MKILNESTVHGSLFSNRVMSWYDTQTFYDCIKLISTYVQDVLKFLFQVFLLLIFRQNKLFQKRPKIPELFYQREKWLQQDEKKLRKYKYWWENCEKDVKLQQKKYKFLRKIKKLSDELKHKQGKSFRNDMFQRPSMDSLQHQQYHVINFIIDKKCISKALGLHYPWIAQNLSTLQSISYLLLFALGFLKANCNIHDCK